MVQDIRLLFAEPYETVREDCHLVKEPNLETITKWAEKMVAALPQKTVLVPVPGHTGIATDTKILAEHIVAEASWAVLPKDIIILDCLTSKPRRSLCEMKKEGYPVKGLNLGIHLVYKSARPILKTYLNDGYKLILIDNVIDTGTTIRNCISALGHDAGVLCIGDTGAWRQDPYEISSEKKKEFSSTTELLSEIDRLESERILYRIENYFTPDNKRKYVLTEITQSR